MIEIAQMRQAIADADAGKPATLPAVEGYSSDRVRRLLNNLNRLPGASYLEIGVHLGSTFIPALAGNLAPATCIDNWSLFGNLRPQFEANLGQHLPRRKINVIEGDCFALDPAQAVTNKPITVYFYDGAHDRRSQYLALAHFAPVLAQRFVLLVDDFNWAEPREETHRAIKDLKWRTLDSVVLPARVERDTEQWWNGLFVALVEK